MPSKDSYHEFKNWGNAERLPYCIYADAESLLIKQDERHPERHDPAAFGFLLVPHPELKYPPLPTRYYEFVGPHCIVDALKEMEVVARQVSQWVKLYANAPCTMSPQEKAAHKKTGRCYICSREFVPKDPLKRKVVEHDHLTGKYRGAACQECNTKMRKPKNMLPIIMHNLKNYDLHTICRSGLGQMKHWQLKVISQTTEKYLGMAARFLLERYTNPKTKQEKTVYMNLRFLDSFQFMSASLDSLVRNLTPQDLRLCRQLQFPSDDLITSKGVFPYSHFDSFDRLHETHLPSREAFRSSLTGEALPEEDYQRAQEAWRLLNCQTFRDYMSAYLKRDVYQLADVFENFRSLSLREDGLDPVYYFTAPGLTWDSAFKKTKARVELLSDQEMYEFAEKGIRGGMTFVNEHEITANCPRLPDTYDASKPQVDLLYVDANNLYGHALSQKLPQHGFRWLSSDEISALDIVNADFTGDTGYLLEVDLTYPADVQDRTVDLPFAPEQHTVEEDMYTPFMTEQWRRLMDIRYGNPNKSYKAYDKLMLTHYDREKYVIHGQLLQYYLKQGLQLTKIHRAMSFYQSAFFEPYISYNSAKRQQATNSFEKDYYKLKNNALFGKTMENVRKRSNFRLCNTEEKLTTYASRPEFLYSVIFTEDLVGVKMVKEQIYLEKPVYIGQAVLELSKLEMYELRYTHLARYEQQLGGRIRVAGGDTDSFFLRIDGIDVAHDLLPRMKHDQLLDSSNYPKEHPLFSDACKARLGCIKDECEGLPCLEWILLRPKCYSMLMANNKEKKRAKGVRRFTVGKVIRHAHYRDIFKTQTISQHKQRRIGSQLHQNYTLDYLKLTLSFWEDKRAWVSANVSLPYGNHNLTQERRPPSLKRSAPPVAPDCLQPAAKSPRHDFDDAYEFDSYM